MTSKKSIVETISEHLSRNTLDVPVFHAVALKLQQVLAKPDYTLEEISQLIVADPGVASQVLRVANSVFYSGLSKATTIRDAAIRLGAKEVSNIAMLATQQDFYRSSNEQFNPIMQTLWKHALCCAIGTKWLATKTGYGALAQEGFLAGLLHDIGKLFLLKVLDELCKSGELGISVSPALVSEVLNSMHEEQGYILMKKWNMPDIYCDVVQDHHNPEWNQTNPLLALVRLVDQACNKMGIGMCPAPTLVLFATTEAQVLGAKEIILAELEIVIEDTLQMVSQGTK
ncbi:HDOD domain-containing protein [Geobacter pelophilus]|uniref:HDOD domain-containing protein n=1 Tax=Geoanaerobacter pelophilus TaxID=60036 RepID=A0AAW4L4E2_9BACT|nr:HDOD domain-containing protein [Geoanaerobacter pelophilus]MBT0666064.1 HDOD domain-containing protein [Geoanaerobacter pelophilus]